MKKVFSLVLCLVSILCIFTACSEETLVYYDYDNMEQYISVSQYKGVEFKQTSPEIIKIIQDRYHSDMKNYNLASSIVMPKGSKVEDGDTVHISYVGKKDGVAFEGGTSTGTDLVIGSNSYIDGFEDGLIGVELGKTVDLNLTFPNDYQNKDLAGKKVVFTVTVKTITRTVYPTLSSVGEVMAREMGYDNLKAYEDAVIKSVKTDTVWKTQILELSTVVKFPEKEYARNVQYFETLYQNLVSTYGKDMVATAVKSGAEERTKEELVGYYIAKKEKISVTEEELNEKVLKDYGSDYTPQEKENTRLSLIMDKVINFCVDNAVVK